MGAKHIGEPSIIFDLENSSITMSGRCYPKKAALFFDNVKKKIEAFLKQTDTKQLALKMKVEYMNSISVKFIYEIISNLKKATTKKEINLLLEWSFEDEDLEDLGIFLTEQLDLNTTYKEVLF